MPERNLVRIDITNRICWGLIVVLTLSVTQSGCSKLRQSTLSQDLLGARRTSDRSLDRPESAYDFVRQSSAKPEPHPIRDEARIVGIKDGEARDIDVKLTASQPASAGERANAETRPAVDNLFCEHSSECDCHKPKTKPKLPHAEPVDPALIASDTPAKIVPKTKANPVPPREVVYQPLKPIMSSGSPRAAQTTDVEAARKSLRRTENWSHENVATLEKKPATVESALGEFDAATETLTTTNQDADGIDLAPAVDQVASVRPNAREQRDGLAAICNACRLPECGGRCTTEITRNPSPNLRPVVDSEPIVIVATNNEETIPPFANTPNDDENPTLRVVVQSDSEPAIAAEAQLANDAESIEDLEDEAWLAMFAPTDVDRQACPACETGECQKPDCQELVAGQSNDFNPQLDASNPAPSMNPNQQASTTHQASPIAVTSSGSGNDFQPVAHHSEPADETPVESSAWTTPTEAAEPANEMEFRAEQPTDQNNVPALDEVPIEAEPQSQPATGSMRRYTGPNVRFEVIDNTVPWSVQLDETIKNVKSKLANEEEPDQRNGLEVNLRLLEVLQRQMADVNEQQSSLSDEEKEYWQHQLDAITLMLQPTDSEDSDMSRHQSAIDTLDHLRKAVERLESIADLRVANGAFCTEVSGFGQFREFPTTTFAAGQPLLIYCEIENFSSSLQQVHLGTEVRTRLRGSYVIYDQQGRAVQQAEYPVVEDVARKRRRDFYMHFPLQLSDLVPGQYRLELLVEDLNGNKTGAIKPGLSFDVR